MMNISMRPRSSLRAESLALAIAIAARSGVALAEGLTGGDIRRDIVGHTIYLSAPMGGEFPLNYRNNGEVDGNGQALGLGRFIKPSDTGHWWVDGDRLCQQFKTWYNGAPKCFTLTKAGPKLLKWLRDDGDTGMARIGQ
jgi:hypothetical protein